MTAQEIRAMVLVPHPDDETLLAGATIAKLVACGAVVDVRAATPGQRGKGGNTIAERIRIRTSELKEACRALGVASADSWSHMDGDLFDTPELRTAIVTAVEAVAANLLITTAPWDYHTDHRALGSTALNCQHRYTKGAPALVFMDQFRGSGLGIVELDGAVTPDTYLDATDFWLAKEAAYAKHASQGGHLAEYMRDLGRRRGQERKPPVKYAECFSGPRTARHDEGLDMLKLALESE